MTSKSENSSHSQEDPEQTSSGEQVESADSPTSAQDGGEQADDERASVDRFGGSGYKSWTNSGSGTIGPIFGC